MGSFLKRLFRHNELTMPEYCCLFRRAVWVAMTWERCIMERKPVATDTVLRKLGEATDGAAHNWPEKGSGLEPLHKTLVRWLNGHKVLSLAMGSENEEVVERASRGATSRSHEMKVLLVESGNSGLGEALLSDLLGEPLVNAGAMHFGLPRIERMDVPLEDLASWGEIRTVSIDCPLCGSQKVAVERAVYGIDPDDMVPADLAFAARTLHRLDCRRGR